MKKLAYILPIRLDHNGINVKVDGQITTLKRYYNTTLIQIQYDRKSSFIQTLWSYITFQYRSYWALLTSPNASPY